MTLLRLNYAIDLRYGVLLDIAQQGVRAAARRPDMGHVNVIWQGDANSVCLRSLALRQSPPAVLNVTGPETVRCAGRRERFGARFGIEPVLEGAEAPTRC